MGSLLAVFTVTIVLCPSSKLEELELVLSRSG
jgi:hypothetical protein